MNERIKELATQAGYKDFDYAIIAHKFAELIIQECVKNLTIHATCFDNDVSRGIKIAARLTREHFGVKEQ